MKPNKNFSNHAEHYRKSPSALYEALKINEPSAIRYLHSKTQKHVNIKRYAVNASPEDAEELANDAILIVLKKIQNGCYIFQGFSPLSFTLVIADNLLRNFARKKKMIYQPLEGQEHSFQTGVDEYMVQKEVEMKIKKVLDKLDPNSQLIIRLKYFEGLKDDEVVNRKLTPYTTTDSLKSKRCACMRKLSAILKPIWHSNLVLSA